MSELIEQQTSFIKLLQRRWMVGCTDPVSLDQAPDDWRTILECQPIEKRELCLLALCSQFQSLMYVPELKSPLKAKPDLPDLPIPVIPDNVRPLFRRILQSIKKMPGIRDIHILRLLLHHQYTAHPADWLPLNNEDLPATYYPWYLWTNDELKKESISVHDQLNADNWDSFYPAERVALLREMRSKDRAAAAKLIEQCAPRETADIRFKIIETLSVNLHTDDSDFLRFLINDRSQKIVRLAVNFLARLGHSSTTGDTKELEAQAQELADGFELKKTGILKKKLHIVPITLKSNKQQAVRSELLERVPFSDFARALKVDGEDLATFWRFSENRDQDNRNFLLNALNTASDNHIDILYKNIISQIDSCDSMIQLMQILLPRLNENDRKELPGELINSSSAFTFTEFLSFPDLPVPGITRDKLVKTSAWKKIKEQLSQNPEKSGCIENPFVVHELFSLGLIIPGDLAEKIIAFLVDMGVLLSDPALDTLKLNSQLYHLSNRG